MSGDRRLQEAFAREMGRQASQSVTRALSSLESITRATGDQKFEPLVLELREVRQRIDETAGRE